MVTVPFVVLFIGVGIGICVALVVDIKTEEEMVLGSTVEVELKGVESPD